MKCIENQVLIVRRHEELRNIQKSETGSQMIFGIQSIEEMVKKDIKKRQKCNQKRYMILERKK